jgi:DDE superfamily endonuclease
VLNPKLLARLRSFRQELYDALGLRQDSLFELVDAVLSSPERRTLVRLSLCPCFRRRWPSAPDALADGTVDVDGLRALFQAAVPPLAPGTRPLWVVDGTHWPRPAAATSPARTWEHRPLPGKPQQGVVPAWAYHWLVQVPEREGSWVLPLDVQRRGPGAGTPTQVAIHQIAQARAAQAPDHPRPVVALDSAHDVAQLAQAHLEVDLVVRLAKHRVFRRAPGPYSGRGRPCKHGRRFKLRDARTHGRPTRSASLEHPVYGTVTIAAWTDLHVEDAAAAPFTVVRVQVEHLPRHGRPAPLWLAWIGGPLPADLHQVWRWYLGRFTVEHAFRFAKTSLGWTTARPRHPAAADRWTWLLAAAFWQLWLARPLVADQRLPWERPLPAARLTPGRVRQAFSGLLVTLGTPAQPPQRRGKSPGRRPGQLRGPRQRFAVIRRPPANATRRRRTRRRSPRAA